MSIDLINITIKLDEIEFIIHFFKTLFLSICTVITFFKIIEYKSYNKNIIVFSIVLCIMCILISMIKYCIGTFFSTICLILLLSLILSTMTKNNIGYTIIITIIALSINYILFVLSIIIDFIPNIILKIENDFVNLIIMAMIHSIILFCILRLDKLKYGVAFLKKNIKNEYFDILILNISVNILFIIVIFANRELMISRSIFWEFIIFSIIMFITIQKSLQLYYKQKMLIKELEESKKEIENKNKEIEELEKENIKISKKSHTLSHKPKSLEYKIEQIIKKSETSKEETAEVQERLKAINKEFNKEKLETKLPKTEIPEIDDMLKYMQSECIKNKIDFEIQISGNIHHMVNNIISKEDIETLLADHIKNAIIAINHSNNINKSILVKIGKAEKEYGISIYDSGIEFEEKTLDKLGKIPSTTHKDEGGTGMGFMNTFETLKKYQASLIIEEYNKPSKDNYTKAIKIKFDRKNEFTINSYRKSK